MSVLEDAYEDVIAKAQRGLGLSDLELMERSGLSMIEIEAAKSGRFDPEAAARLAESLGLGPAALSALGQHSYVPKVKLPDGVRMFTTPAPVPGYEEMTVNSYLVFDPETKDAALFDTGTSLEAVAEAVETLALEVKYVALTHTHPDHVEALSEARERFPNARYLCPQKELLDGLNQIRPGNKFTIGSVQVEARLTPGHSPGGMTYVIAGLEKPLAIVGDAIFAGSVGGMGSEVYGGALETIRDQILGESTETILLPGHKTATTVGQELKHNPFFATE